MKIAIWILNAILMHFILITKPFAQDKIYSQYKYNVGIGYMKGFLLPHNDQASHLTYGRPWGLETSFNLNSIGEKPWQKRYNFPETGISLSYFDTDMKETGHLLSGIIYMKFHMLRTHTGSFIFQAGTGLTYASERYNRESNNLNNLISSVLTYNMQGRLGYQFNMGRYMLFPSITLTHASNGSLKLPNAGINIVTANLSLQYHIGEIIESVKVKEESPLNRKLALNVLISGTAKEIYPTGGPKYGYFTIRSYADKTLSRYSRILAGGEMFFNRSLKAQIESNPEVPDDMDYKRVGLLIGHELQISKVSVMTQFGYYVYRPYDEDEDPDYYQRYGLKYYITENIFGTAMLKTFLGRADTFDFGIGYRL